jgi:segregation and condensation protein A
MPDERQDSQSSGAAEADLNVKGDAPEASGTPAVSPVEPSPPAPKRVSYTAEPPPPVKLDVYEGPLDLLLDLIRKQEINIYDIPIARITRQYLDYLQMLEAMNIDIAGDFVLMAATLIHIKSRMLLPPDPEADPEEQEDPRAELVKQLLEHEQFRNAAEMLASKRMLEDAMWTQPGVAEFQEAEDEPGLAVSVFDLISAFREILERAKKHAQFAVRREEVSVADMMERVKQVLLEGSHSVRLDDLASGYTSRQAMIALFLALLEMVRLHAVFLRQKELFAPISVHKSKRFSEIMSQISAADLLESEAYDSNGSPETEE